LARSCGREGRRARPRDRQSLKWLQYRSAHRALQPLKRGISNYLIAHWLSGQGWFRVWHLARSCGRGGRRSRAPNPSRALPMRTPAARLQGFASVLCCATAYEPPSRTGSRAPVPPDTPRPKFDLCYLIDTTFARQREMLKRPDPAVERIWYIQDRQDLIQALATSIFR